MKKQKFSVYSKSGLLLILISFFISCNQVDLFTEATVDILYISSITDSTAILEGQIYSDGGTSILKSGVCWSTLENPTIANNRTTDPLTSLTDGVPSGYFESSLIGLASGTRYYLRAYATNKVGTSYGRQIIISTLTNTGSVLDIDGNEYTTVTIGDQTWMVENLKTTKYNDGTSIPNITDGSTWSNLTTPGYCWNNNDTTNKVTNGALYNWYTIETGKLAPTSWHVPSNRDWETLENFLISNGYNYDSTTTDNKIAKSLAATTGWPTASEIGAIGNDLTKNNSSGFSALPSGCRNDNGSFSPIGRYAAWWCSSELMEDWAYFRILECFGSNLYYLEFPMKNGFSVRCVRDF